MKKKSLLLKANKFSELNFKDMMDKQFGEHIFRS